MSFFDSSLAALILKSQSKSTTAGSRRDGRSRADQKNGGGKHSPRLHCTLFVKKIHQRSFVGLR